MSAKQSPGTRKPAAEHVEHAQGMKTRSSVNQRDDYNKSTQRKPANNGQPTQKPIDVVSNRPANPGPGRRPSGVEEVPPHDPNTARIRKIPLHEPTSPKRGNNGTSPRSNKVPIPEKSELRAQRRSIDTGSARPKQVSPREQHREHPKEATIVTTRDGSNTVTPYRPGYVLRRNAEYLDVDQDGVIGLRDTYAGCRKLGWGIPLSSLAMLTLHTTLSYPTSPSILPDPALRIRYDASQNNSKQESHDNKREKSTPQNACESILAKYDASGKGGLNFSDILRFWADQRSVLGAYEWCTAVVEWLTLYTALWPRDGILRAADIRGAFDGNLPYKRAEEHQRSFNTSKKGRNGSSGTRDDASGGLSNPTVKLAVALVTGVAILIWAFRNLKLNSPGWAAYWWEKDGAQAGEGLADSELFEAH